MIVKKIKPDTKKPKSASIRDLVDYVLDADSANGEKLLHSGSRGFICTHDQRDGQRAEMVALAGGSTRSKNPVNHYIISWREGEQPTPAQVDEAVNIFLDELKLTGHQVIYGLHQNTDNIHVHIVVNRVHPETGLVTEINRGFDIRAAHAAIARIEHVQGWQPEKRAIYQVDDNQQIVPRQTKRQQKQTPSPRADLEHRTGEKSAVTRAIEIAGPIIRDAKNWSDLHQRLAQVGMEYQRRGSGAVIFVGDVAVKSSSVDRNASLSKMEKRLGAFSPLPDAENKSAPKRIEPEPVSPDFPRWQRYSYSRKKHFENKRATKIELDRKIAAERNQLFTRQRQQREELKRQNWRGRGSELNFMRSILAAQHAAEKSELQERISDMRRQWRLQYPPWPDFETWLNERRYSADALRWRYRTSDVNVIAGKSNSQPVKLDIRDYEPRASNNAIFYDHRESKNAAFVDRGQTVQVLDSDATLAALQLAVQKFGGNIEIYGNDKFRKKCIQLCIQHNIHITNPDLQIEIEEEREKLTKSKISQPPAAVQKLPPKPIKSRKPNEDKIMVKFKLPDHENIQLFKKYMNEFEVDYFDHHPMRIDFVDDGRKFTIRFKKSAENKITTDEEEKIIAGRMRSAFRMLCPLDIQMVEHKNIQNDGRFLQVDKRDLEKSNIFERTPARRLWHCAMLAKIMEELDILADPYSGVVRIQSQHAQAAQKIVSRWGGEHLFLRHGADVLEIRTEPEQKFFQPQRSDENLLPLSDEWMAKLAELKKYWGAIQLENFRDGITATFEGDVNQAENYLIGTLKKIESLHKKLGDDLLSSDISINYIDDFQRCSFTAKISLNLPASERRPVPTPDPVQTENKTTTKTKTKTGRRGMRMQPR